VICRATRGFHLRAPELPPKTQTVGHGSPTLRVFDCLPRFDSIDRAYPVTRAAIYASLFVDNKLVIPCGNTGYRAFGLTYSAADAIVIDIIRHNSHLQRFSEVITSPLNSNNLTTRIFVVRRCGKAAGMLVPFKDLSYRMAAKRLLENCCCLVA